MKRYFITGTDTDCGKTYITAQLIQFFKRSAAIKPVASGCQKTGQQLISADAQELARFCTLSLEEINPWRFALPVSPHIAADKEQRILNLDDLVTYCLDLQLPDIDTLFIEGAGGLIVPLNERETWVDFLKQTNIPVILVVGMKLGCINHALLTITALRAHHIKCAGWIANCLDPDMLALDENIATIEQHVSAPLLSVVPYKGLIKHMNL